MNYFLPLRSSSKQAFSNTIGAPVKQSHLLEARQILPSLVSAEELGDVRDSHHLSRSPSLVVNKKFVC